MTNKSIALFFVVLLCLAVPSVYAEKQYLFDPSKNGTWGKVHPDTPKVKSLGIVQGKLSGTEFNILIFTTGKSYTVKQSTDKLKLGSIIKLECFGSEKYPTFFKSSGSIFPSKKTQTEIDYCKILKVQKQ